MEDALLEATKLGFGEPVAISAETGNPAAHDTVPLAVLSL